MIRFNCSHCTKVIKVQEKFAGKKGKCPGCGEIIHVPQMTEDSGSILPVETSQASQIIDATLVPSVTPPNRPISKKKQTASGMALASLITGIFGLCCFPSGIAAIIFGLIAINEIKKPANAKSGKGMAIVGTTLGSLGLVFFLVLSVMSVFAKTDLEQANALWEKGKKDEAVEIYASKVIGAGDSDSLALKRTAEYYFEKGDKERATYFVKNAVVKKVRLSLEPKELRDIYAKAEADHIRKEKERRAQKLAEAEAQKADSLKKELAKIPLGGNTPEADTRELRQLIIKAVGTEGLSFKIFDYFHDPKQKLVQVRWDIGDNLTNSMIRFSAKRDIELILKAVDESGINCFEVTVFGNFPLTDKLGNSSKDLVAKATYSGSTIKKINWTNFLTDNIYEIADDTWFHPAFRE